jgi:LmbE family N-acetylglucosaminyl deacetylase
VIRRTLVSFHAHPDDEALLTGGTLARAAAEGHRVVLVVATDGEAGLASVDGAGGDLRRTRVRELDRAAAALGCADVVRLGFADSGWRVAPAAGAFSLQPVEAVAEPLARLLRQERADVLTTYDAAGGYGHPDHRQVHHVGRRAAELAATPIVLQATVPREPLHRIIRLAARMPGLLDNVDPAEFASAFTPRRQITHRIDVRAHLDEKREAMRAHASQATSAGGPRTLELLLRLPRPLFAAVAGREWFARAGAVDVHPDTPDGRNRSAYCTDVFSGRP